MQCIKTECILMPICGYLRFAAEMPKCTIIIISLNLRCDIQNNKLTQCIRVRLSLKLNNFPVSLSQVFYLFLHTQDYLTYKLLAAVDAVCAYFRITIFPYAHIFHPRHNDR